MNWSNARIGDLGRVVTGKTPSRARADYFGDQHPFVTPSDFGFMHYYCTEVAEGVSELGFEKHTRQTVPRDASMCVCIGNTIGKCAIASEPCLTNQQINSVIAGENSDSKFVYYLLCSMHDQIRAVGLGGGAAQPIINKTKFSALEVQVPDLKTQRAIADILSAYDDLIENNRRRIALLEDAARLLYREWFVHFRFPGHERVKITDGLPEGWGWKSLIEAAEVVMGQSPKSVYYNEIGEGLPFHQGVTGYGQRFLTDRIYSSAVTKVAEAGDILVSVRAPVGRINITQNKIVLGRGLAAIRSRAAQQSYLFYALKNHFHTEDIIGSGSIYAATNKKELESQALIDPTPRLLKEFELQANAIDGQILCLTNQNEKLVQARDLLLPRLMNGEIAV